VTQAEHIEAPRRPRTAIKTEAAVERTGDEAAPRSGQPVVENSLSLRQKAEQTTLAAEKTLTTATAADAGDKAAQPGAPGGSEALANAPMRIATDARSRPNSAAARAVDTGPVDRARLVQRVERAFQAMSDRGGSIRLRLSPPELGSLKVEITVRDGTMTARLETETHAAKNLLLDNLPALRERLAQQDIKVQQFDVELMDRSPGGTPDQSAYSAGSFAGGGGGGGAGRTPAQPAPEANIAAPGPSAAGRPGEASQLNVVV
jgi:flagellar hook-length control protein FliK